MPATLVRTPTSAPSWTIGSPGCGSLLHGEHAQPARRGGAARVHPLDELLAGVAALREVDGPIADPGLGRDRLAGDDLRTHRRPPGGDASPLELVERALPHALGRHRVRPDEVVDAVDATHGDHPPRHGLDVRLDPDAEPVEAGDERLAVAAVDVEDERVVIRAPDPGEHLDPPGRLEQERPPAVADGHAQEVLGHLPVEVGQGVGPADPHDVSGLGDPERIRHGVQHARKTGRPDGPSVERRKAWHTRSMADVDQLAQLTVAMVTNLARRGRWSPAASPWSRCSSAGSPT